MHAARKDNSQTRSEYRPSRSGRGTDPLDSIALNGDCVRDAEGEEIGRIEGVMLDGNRNRIMYAILSFGGNAKLFAVPWSVLKVNHDEACVVLDNSRERMHAAPSFDRNSWPSITDRSWRDEVDAYYGSGPGASKISARV